MRLKFKASDRWSIGGFILGTAFVFFYAKIMLLEYQTVSLKAMHHWIVFLLPIIFSGLFKVIGRQKEAIQYYSEFLGKKIDEKTGQLIRSDLKIKEQLNEKNNLLEHIPLGLFSFDKSGYLSKDKSLFLLKLLPELTQMSHVTEFFSLYFKKKPQQIQILMNLLWNDEGIYYHFDTIASKFGKEFKVISEEHIEKYFRVTYIDLKNSVMDLEKIIVLITDETDNHHALAQKDRQEETIHQLELASENLAVFKAFTDESLSLAERISGLFHRRGVERNKSDVLNLVHTLKGNWSAFGFLHSAKKLHQLENLLAESNDLSVDGKEESYWKSAYSEWRDTILKIEDILGTSGDETIAKVDKIKLRVLEKKIAAGGSVELLNLIKNLQRIDIEKLMERSIQYIQKMAMNRRKILKVTVKKDSDGLDPAEFARVEGYINHILKNCLDHGIESPETRELIGKEKEGHIEISCKRDDGKLMISVQDDGRGLDLQKLKDMALSLGIWSEEKILNATNEDLVNLIFVSGISTHGTVDEVSGRGVGLNYVKRELEKFGGKLSVSTIKDQGTRMDLIFCPPE